MLITPERVRGNRASLGYSLFSPGSVSNPIMHEAEEFVFVAKGRGELRTDDGVIEFEEGDALHIPPGVWHWIANTGSEDVVQIFGFPTPEYPPTQRRADPEAG